MGPVGGIRWRNPESIQASQIEKIPPLLGVVS